MDRVKKCHIGFVPCKIMLAVKALTLPYISLYIFQHFTKFGKCEQTSVVVVYLFIGTVNMHVFFFLLFFYHLKERVLFKP